MNIFLRTCWMACWLALAGAASAAPALPSTNVQWLAASSDADVERAFARARSENKPVLLYWGARWCPPCNQLKATLFNRQDFALQSRSLVAISVDGDLPGAQKLGQRFKVSGYPTVVLFNNDGAEITRLPGEVDAPQMLAVLQLGMAGGRPVKAVLADFLSGHTLGDNEWRLLAYYSWDTDEQQLVPKAELPALLARLAAAAPVADVETSNRLWLKTLAASDDGQGVKPDAALRERVMRILNDAPAARAQMDVLTGHAADILRTLAPEGSAEAAPLATALDFALRRLQADITLSRADRLSALQGRVDLARLGLPKEAVDVNLPPALLSDVQNHVRSAVRDTTDAYEREAVIPEAAYVLGQAGLWDESDSLLKAELAKSPSPYYLMSQLASNARKRGRKDEALRWYSQAFEKSQGPATRLQWGASYLGALVDLAPQDSARIEKTAAQLFAEAARDRAAFEGRSARSLQRVGNKLVGWNAKGEHAASVKRLQAQLAGLCSKRDAADGQRAACQALLQPKKLS